MIESIKDELIDNGFMKETLRQQLSYRIKKIWYKLLFLLFLSKIYIKKKFNEL